MVNEGVGLELGEARVFKRSGRGLGTIRGKEENGQLGAGVNAGKERVRHCTRVFWGRGASGRGSSDWKGCGSRSVYLGEGQNP